jgi:predicted enzyme related to lactoylglutathione lyase
METNMVGWFEIPVKDMERAMKFYETVFNVKLDRNQLGPLDMAWFPSIEDGKGSSGSLVRNEHHYKPSKDGTLIYFTSQAEDISVELARIEKAGGKIMQPRTLIADDIGYMALVLDTEGNRIALHSRK